MYRKELSFVYTSRLGPMQSVLNATISTQPRALPPFVVFMAPLSLAYYVFLLLNVNRYDFKTIY